MSGPPAAGAGLTGPGRVARSLVDRSGALLALATFAVVIAVLWRRVGIPILSLDDIFRTVFAHQWAQAPYFFTERLVWLPVPLIVTGLVMRATGEAFWTALGVDLAASAIAIAYVYLLAERLFGRLAAWVAASLFGLTPWILFLSLSRYGEPVLLAATAIGAYYWVRWSESGEGRALTLAALALTAAVLSRYEAWPLGAALFVHVALTRLSGRRKALSPGRHPRLPALWAGLPVVAIAVWMGKNLAVYGRPVYGGGFGFLPGAVPEGAWGGVRLAAQYLWEMNPVLAVLGLLGGGLHLRRAPLLCALAGLAALVPWYTVGFFSIEVALPGRLMVVPLMLLAPLAGAAVARTVRPRPAAVALAALLVGAQLATDLRLEYPAAPPPMTALALGLSRSGDLDRFDALYVQSAHPRGHPDEVRVATNFRRPIHVLPMDAPGLPWGGNTAAAALVLNDGRSPPGGEGFVVARVGEMTAWGVCREAPGADPHPEWLEVRAPRSVPAGARMAVEVTLRNAGPGAWHAGGCGASLFHRWLRDDGGRSGGESWTPLPERVEPGQTLRLAASLVAPASEGAYTLEVGLAARRPGSDAGGSYRLPVRVAGG